MQVCNRIFGLTELVAAANARRRIPSADFVRLPTFGGYLSTNFALQALEKMLIFHR
jgi:hypothetical protein